MSSETSNTLEKIERDYEKRGRIPSMDSKNKINNNAFESLK